MKAVHWPLVFNILLQTNPVSHQSSFCTTATAILHPKLLCSTSPFSAGILSRTVASIAGCTQYRLALGVCADGREHGQMTLQTAHALPEQDLGVFKKWKLNGCSSPNIYPLIPGRNCNVEWIRPVVSKGPGHLSPVRMAVSLPYNDTWSW